ncbi:ABC transporter [Rhodoferax lacus]|uniref:ABC transporter n=1 Tax=Rhodoferax lacus TaxID=2184758 RepID=A0A3E1RFM2_9BURK|nr:ATP-binding cassette domain-containing protein [Rhodoferax lacus]RFO98177.1 ABC transporter [Rhodoferax lacus]
MIRSTALTYQYTGGPRLEFPDVDLAQGSVLLLSGPSGCGKSTWLALVAALVAPTSGTLTVAEQPLQKLQKVASDAWRARTIGFLPQKLHLSAALSVQQNLAMAQWASGQAEDPVRIHSALQALGVAELAGRKPAQLSGGQAQRVALARAVLLQPRVILADEPTASLDDEAASDAVNLLLQAARQQQATLVIATHDARVSRLLQEGGSAPTAFEELRLSRPAKLGATT